MDLHTYIHVCIAKYAYVYICICLSAYVYICAYEYNTCVYVYTSMYRYLSKLDWVNNYTHVDVCPYVNVYVYSVLCVWA